MKTYYLIDYENVRENGFKTVDMLNPKNRIVLFFTKHANKIDIRSLTVPRKAKLAFVETPAGKQSADLCIASHVGALLQQPNLEKQQIIIISNDTGFDYLTQFWNHKTPCLVKRQGVTITSVTTTLQDATSGTSPAHIMPSKERQQVNHAVMKALSKHGYRSQIIGGVAGIVAKALKTESPKQATKDRLINTYGTQKGEKIYSIIAQYLKY